MIKNYHKVIRGNGKIITFMLSGEFTVALHLYGNLNLGGSYS